jgi:hypothetical protein
MPATNYTPIQLYRSGTASNTPSAGNLNDGELAINYNDGLLFYKDSGNAVQVIGRKNPGYLNIPQSGSAKATAYTLATSDVGEFIEVGSGGSIEIPDATFSAGDAVLIFNNTASGITITCTITTAYIAGTDADKATMTLATRGIASILFVSGTVCAISGNVS